MPGFEPGSNEPFAEVRYPLLDLYDSTVKLKLKITLAFHSTLSIFSQNGPTRHAVRM